MSHDPEPFRLVPCDGEGRPSEPVGELPADIAEACAGTAELYRRIGFEPPWIGYLAVVGEAAVGGGAFVGAPADGRVEIAYFTSPEHQGRGHAGRTAQALVEIARRADPGLAVFAKTEPQTNASTAILTRLGFRRTGSVTDDEIGEAWAWLLEPGART